MRIGILTQRLHLNYGGLLQNYALQTVLKRAGHEVHTLDWAKQPRNMQWYVKVFGLYIAHALMPGRFEKPKVGYTPNRKESEQINRYIKKFISDQISRTELIKSSKGFSEISQELGLDAFIVGSDQCWRPSYNRFLPDMFLSFIKDRSDVKRIAYAASFGTDNWEYDADMTVMCGELARKFDVISVREDSGVDLCNKYFKTDAHLVLDPTMLLTKEDYAALIESYNEPESDGNLFYYFLDPTEDKLKIVRNLENKMGLKPFSILPKHNSDHLTKDDVKSDIDNCIYPSVTKWLRAFKDSEITLVDSYHGMVFSILFNRPFWVIGNEKRGLARFKSLLKLFGLEDRLVTTEKIEKIDINRPIDWNQVNMTLKNWREKSLELLFSKLS